MNTEDFDYCYLNEHEETKSNRASEVFTQLSNIENIAGKSAEDNLY